MARPCFATLTQRFFSGGEAGDEKASLRSGSERVEP